MAGLLDIVSGSAPVWQCDLPRNDKFGGRDEFFSLLRDRLYRRTLFDHTQVLHGPAGVGKTQIALEYAYRNREAYDIIAWIRAGDEAMREADFARLAVTLGMASAETSPMAALSALRAGLAARERWLLILDDLARSGDLVGLLPRTIGGHVIVTSRSSDWRDIAPALPILQFSRDESIFFLRKRSGKQDSMLAVSQLAKALADHPLALEQAAIVVDRTGISFDQYLRRLENSWGDLLRRGRPSTSYPEAIAMSWEVLARQVRDVSRMAADLVNLIAHFADEPIPQWLLAAGADCVTEPLAGTLRDEQRRREATTLLAQYAAVDAAGNAGSESIRIHALNRSLARDRLAPQERKNWALMALNTVSAAFVFDSTDLRTWSTCDAILPHALVAAEHATALGVGVDSASSLLNEVGLCLYRRAQYFRAKTVLDRALTFGHQVYGEKNPRLSAIANNLARVLTRLGEPNEAREQLEWALALDEQAYGPMHPHVAEVLNNLAVALLRCGEPKLARDRLERALIISIARYGNLHATVGMILNNLGYVLMRGGDLLGATERLERALSTCETTLGPAHPEVGSVLHNLGDLYRAKREWPAAEKHYERALAISRVAYGPNHPDVARDLGDLGALMLETNRPGLARQHIERAIAIEETTYGGNHPNVAARLEDLGRALKALDDVDGAVRCAERIRKIERVAAIKRNAQQQETESTQ